MSSLTTGTSLRTRETVATLTPAWRATSRIVGGRSSRAKTSSMVGSVTGRQSSALDSRGGRDAWFRLQYRFPCHLPETGYSLSNVGPWRRGRMRGRFGLGAAIVVSLAMFAAACGGGGGGSSSSGGGGGGASSSSSSSGSAITVNGAKVIDTITMTSPPKGTIHYCTGKDTNGAAHQLIKDFNSKYSSAGYKAVLTEFPASADQQRAQFIQRQQAKSNDCDVFNSDVIWTA